MRYYIETIGCQMNENDSALIAAELSSYGFERVDLLDKSDIAIINTCSVRALAEHKASSWLGRAAEYKQKHKSVKIIVVGCMAERLGQKIQKRFKAVDLVVGAKDIENASRKILSLLGKEQVKSKIEINIPSSEVSYVTIMRGCDNYCSYCVVPFVRGKEISLDSAEVINECKKLVKNGTKEIMLLGQNVNSYKHGDITFAKLLKEIAEIENLGNLTFMTSHPKDLSDELIEVMASESKIRKYIHLPLQSGSDKILALMNRKYTIEHYKGLIVKLRAKMPNINITSDIIVGFPGETEEDFNQTLDAVKDMQFDALYIFKYSPRPNTAAAALKDDVSLQEKKRRNNLLLKEARKNK